MALFHSSRFAQRMAIAGTVVLALAWVAGTGVAYWQLHEVLDHHFPNTAWKPSDVDLDYEPVRFAAEDGENLAAWYVPAVRPKAGVVILHGFEETQGGKNEPFAQALVRPLHDAGFAVLMLDLRAFGESDGGRVYLGSKEWMDAAAGYDYLKQRNELKNRLVGYIGDSMGATTAIAAVGRAGKGDFIVASVPQENFATTFRTWVKAEGYPSVVTPFIRSAAYFFLGFDYTQSNPDRILPSISRPIFLIGVENDEEVGTNIERLFALANEPKQLWRPTGSTHVLVDELTEEYHRRVLEFLEGVVKKE